MIDMAREPDLGYYFYPPETPGHPGHPRLDVIIPAEPTHRHFDPQLVRFPVVSQFDRIGRLTVRHPWTSEKNHQACLGHITISDRTNKQVEAYSLGGILEIVSDESRTVCALASPAPILPLLTAHSLSVWLMEELEALLARRRAYWSIRQPSEFEARLAAVEPFTLYACCLEALNERLNETPFTAEGLEHQGQHFLHEEIQRLKQSDKWPSHEPKLEELL